MVDQSYNVRTGLKTIYNIYNGLGQSQCFYINNIEASGLYFEKEKKYQFIQTHISNNGNPLNIYLDKYGNKKLEEYVSISGVAGIDRYVTVSIPKTFTETNTLYYGNESGDFFGAPIKLISTEYYLKYNIKLLCFDAYHDNEKYIIPNNILTKNKNSQSYTSGILPTINKYNNLYGGQAQSGYLTNIRTDVININVLGANKIFMKDNFNFNFFGNNLIYKKNSNSINKEWSNLYELYNLISDLCFTDSGSLNSGENFENYYQYGYQLSGCEGCIDKLTLTTGYNNFYSGVITLFYNPRKIYKNYRSYPRMNVNYEYFSNKDFVTSSYIIDSGNFNYIKYTGAQAYYV
jgi:hypothetical protein